MIDAGTEVHFLLDVQLSENDDTPPFPLSLNAIFRDVCKDCLRFEVSEEEAVNLTPEWGSYDLRCDECEGLNFSNFKKREHKPPLLFFYFEPSLCLFSGKQYLPTLWISSNSGEFKRTKSNQNLLFQHILNTDQRRIKERAELIIGQPIQKHDPAAEGGAM